MFVSYPNKVRSRAKLFGFFIDRRFQYHSQSRLVAVVRGLLNLELFMEVLRGLLHRNPALVIAMPVNRFLTNAIRDFTEINEVVGNVDQFRRRIGRKPATSTRHLIRHRVHRVDKSSSPDTSTAVS